MIITYSVEDGIGKAFNELVKKLNANRQPLEKKINKSSIVEKAMIKFIEKNKNI
jgi:hypothetical protein